MEQVTIYGLQDPRTKQFRYVGITKSFDARLRGHRHSPSLRESDERRLANRAFGWIGELRDHGLEPEMVALEETSERIGALARERTWIAKLFSEDHPLLNKEVVGHGGKEFCAFGRIVMQIVTRRGVCGSTGIHRYLGERGFEITQNAISQYLLGSRTPGRTFHNAFDHAFQLSENERTQYALVATFGHLQD